MDTERVADAESKIRAIYATLEDEEAEFLAQKLWSEKAGASPEEQARLDRIAIADEQQANFMMEAAAHWFSHEADDELLLFMQDLGIGKKELMNVVQWFHKLLEEWGTGNDPEDWLMCLAASSWSFTRRLDAPETASSDLFLDAIEFFRQWRSDEGG
ncbi:MAG: hypothetical protein AAGJ46_20940 [Planctomycetota bacterium]